MKIALACPSYQQRMHVRTGYAWAQDSMTAIEMGWRPILLWADANSIEVSRNLLVQQAHEAEARLLLMIDSDTFPLPPEGGLKHLWKAMADSEAAVVGAAVPIRSGDGMNCQPSLPGQVYPGVVGSAYLLIDTWRLRALPRPWFVLEMAADGMSKQVGSDINFCRKVQAAGHNVVVDFAIQMAHAETVATATRF